MYKEGKRMKKMTLFNLSWPIFIETALFMLLGFVDVYVLSRYSDLAASAAQAANQVVSICTLVFTVISGASAVLISQALGAGDKEKSSRVAALSILFNLLLGIVMSGILVIFCKPFLVFMGAKGEILSFANEYLIIVGAFIFTQALLGAVSVIIRNHGYTKVTMYVTVAMNIINTFLILFLYSVCSAFRSSVSRALRLRQVSAGLSALLYFSFSCLKRLKSPLSSKCTGRFPKRTLYPCSE